jgi:hypothetical protein
MAFCKTFDILAHQSASMKLSQRSIFVLLFLFGLSFSLISSSCNNKNKCENVACINGGSCYNGACVCPVGYEGPRCDTLSRDKFIHNYNGGDSCSVNIFNDTMYYTQYANPVRIQAVFFKPIELLIKNFLDDPNDSAIGTMIQADSFSFLGANNSITYSGTGWLRSDSLFMHYHVIRDTTSYDCDYVGLIY